MSDKEMDADRRFNKWMHEYWKLLERYHMTDFDQRHPKDALKALLEGIRPLSLRESLRQELAHDKKYLRISVLQFLNYVRSELHHQLKYLRAVANVNRSQGDDLANDSDGNGDSTQKKSRKEIEKSSELGKRQFGEWG
ncbi:unnamed protein product [Aphanomyces euteiches]|nr:hypothetical protein Ae201684P_015932 [Aphanomyces euteiches]